MSITETYYRPKGVKYTVNAGEAGSGLVAIPYETAPTKNLLSVVQVATSAGVTKSGFKKTYNSGLGTLTIENDGTFKFAENDVIELLGCWYV